MCVLSPLRSSSANSLALVSHLTIIYDEIFNLLYYFLLYQIQLDPVEAPIRGLTLASTAATLGDRRAMLYLAELNYTGRGNDPSDPISVKPDWCAAAHWYEEAAKTMDLPERASDDIDQPAGPRSADYDSMTVDWPVYRLHGRLAEMYAKGGHGLKQDCSKACEYFGRRFAYSVNRLTSPKCCLFVTEFGTCIISGLVW